MDKLSQRVLDLIQEYDYTENDFDTDQLAEMYLGLKNGLSENQLAAYITLALTADQMMFCRQCGERGFNASKLWKIRFGFGQLLTEDQIKLYADSKYSANQMHQIRYGLQRGFTKNQIKLYADPKYNENQMIQIRLGLENGLSIEQLKEKYTFFRPKGNIQQNEPEIEI